MDIIIKAVLLGLSTGIYCLGFCLPVVFPMIMAGEPGPFKTRSRVLLQFLGGRLAAYLIFGGLAGYAGQNFSHPLIQKLTVISIIILSLILILYGLLKGFPQKKVCLALNNRLPQWSLPPVMGFLTGFNICPPFLLAVTMVFEMGEVVKSAAFFFVFFCVTSLYLIPVVLLGHFSKLDKVRWVAQLSSILAGALFLMMGLGRLGI